MLRLPYLLQMPLLLTLTAASGCEFSSPPMTPTSDALSSDKDQVRTCEEPIHLTLDDDPEPEWAIVCTDWRTQTTDFRVLDSGEVNPIIYQGAARDAGTSLHRIIGGDLDGDGLDEVFVVTESVGDAGQRLFAELDVFARREGLFIDLWDVSPDTDAERRDYDIRDLDQDGRVEVLVTYRGIAGDDKTSPEVWRLGDQGRFVRDL